MKSNKEHEKDENIIAIVVVFLCLSVAALIVAAIIS